MPVGFFGGQRGATTLVFDVTISGTWKGSTTDMHADIDVPGILATDNPIADVVCDSADQYEQRMKAWARIYKIETYNGYIRVHRGDEAVSGLPIRLFVVR